MSGPPKKDFLTIPDAPNYEINGYFKIRNKKTGKFLKPHTKKGGYYANLFVKGKRIYRSVAVFYRQALAAVTDNDEYTPIPSLDNLYEINFEGVVRHCATKRKVKLKQQGNYLAYTIQIKGKCRQVRQAELLKEVFDKNIRRLRRPIPVILRKDGLAYYFKNSISAARFLKPKVGGALQNIRWKLSRRLQVIYGWQVTYLG